MAERRMFAKSIIDSDAFLDMPLSTQSLYFHLSMRADDDGFVNNPKKIQRMIGCNDDDLKVLVAKKFLIQFDDGVCVIKHWRLHNYIQKDRYNETNYLNHKEKLKIKENKTYSLDTQCIQDVSSVDTQVRLGKVSLGKDSEEKHTRKIKNDFTPPIHESLLQAWLVVRKAKRAGKVTELAWAAIEREASLANITPEKAVTICCERGWQSFKAEWIADKQGKQKSEFTNRGHLMSDDQFKSWLGDNNG